MNIRFLRKYVIAAAMLLGMGFPAFAQSLVTDQLPLPLTSTGNSELYTQSQSVAGGTLYTQIMRQNGPQGQPIAMDTTFVGAGSTSLTRYLALTNAKSDLGVPMTAAAGTPAGTVGISRTAGTSMVLTGEATSSSAKTDKALFETNLSDTYIAGNNVPVIVNTNYTGSGTVTAASTTMTVAAYTEVNGVETALTVSAAQQFTASAANYTFTITGTGLAPGAHITIECVMLVTTSAGAATGQINSVAYQG